MFFLVPHTLFIVSTYEDTTSGYTSFPLSRRNAGRYLLPITPSPPPPQALHMGWGVGFAKLNRPVFEQHVLLQDLDVGFGFPERIKTVHEKVSHFVNRFHA